MFHTILAAILFIAPIQVRTFFPDKELGMHRRVLFLTRDKDHTGTGFILGKYVITNAHIATKVGRTVKFWHESLGISREDVSKDRKELPGLKVLKLDAKKDLALLESPWPLPELTIVDPILGEEVFVVSYPISFRMLLFGRVCRIEDPLQFLVDINLAKGSSGAPILNERGELIGVINSFAADEMNTNVYGSNGVLAFSLKDIIGRYFVAVHSKALREFLEE